MSKYDERMKRGFKLMQRMGRQDTMLNQKALYPELYELSVGHLFGDIWTRPHLSLRERQLITLAANIAMARPAGTPGHYRSAQHIGISKEAIMEVIIHVGHYSGWPTIGHAVAQFTQVLEEDASAKKKKKVRRRKAAVMET